MTIEEAKTSLPSGWQPIATAPKDGTQILLKGSNYIRTGYWAKRIESWVIDMVSAPLTMPTLWMPLPPAPAPDGGSTHGK